MLIETVNLGNLIPGKFIRSVSFSVSGSEQCALGSNGPYFISYNLDQFLFLAIESILYFDRYLWP